MSPARPATRVTRLREAQALSIAHGPNLILLRTLTFSIGEAILYLGMDGREGATVQESSHSQNSSMLNSSSRQKTCAEARGVACKLSTNQNCEDSFHARYQNTGAAQGNLSSGE
jgi:hypothetical protein